MPEEELMNSCKSLNWLALLLYAGLSFGGSATANTVSASATPLPNHTLTVNAIGTQSNRDGIGARIRTATQSGAEQYGMVSTAGSTSYFTRFFQ